jgi:hypothetical protein
MPRSRSARRSGPPPTEAELVEDVLVTEEVSADEQQLRAGLGLEPGEVVGDGRLE